MVSQASHQTNHTVLASSVDGNALTIIARPAHCRHNHATLRLLLSHEVHSEFDRVHLSDQRLMVEVVPAVSKAGVGYNDVDPAEFAFCSLEECEKIVPATGIRFLKERSIDWVLRLLKVSNEYFDTSLGKVMDYALPNATATSGNDS